MFPETYNWGYGIRLTARGFAQMAQSLNRSKHRNGLKKCDKGKDLSGMQEKESFILKGNTSSKGAV